MLNLVLPPEISKIITTALERAGPREVGGVLLAEHVGPDEFVVREITVHRRGAVASFVRMIEDAVGRIMSFFRSAKHDYRRFNYLGEWHSHPSFEPEPSGADDASMREIVQDPTVGANFIALLIVKLGSTGGLLASAHVYLPDGSKHPGTVTVKLDVDTIRTLGCALGTKRVACPDMRPNRLGGVTCFSVRSDVVVETLDTLKRFGAEELEGLVLWLGTIVGTRADVTKILVPDQHPIQSESGIGYFVSGETLFAINKTLSETGLRLIAQVHSHPGEAYHSAADDEYAIVTSEGGLSLVVPDFGHALADPSSWAIYRLTSGAWKEIDAEDAQRLIQVD